jgi:hypothetical protein
MSSTLRRHTIVHDHPQELLLSLYPANGYQEDQEMMLDKNQ